MFPFTKEPVNGSGEAGALSAPEAGAVAAATEHVKSKRGGPRPGSGRKPMGGPGVAGTPPKSAGVDQAPVSEADIEFCRTIAEAALKILDRIETNIIIGTIRGIGDKYLEEKTDAFLRQREIGPGDVEIVVNAAGALAAKYSVLSRYAPEAALVSWAAIHGMAFQSVLSELRKLSKIIKEAKAKTAQGGDNAAPPPAH